MRFDVGRNLLLFTFLVKGPPYTACNLRGTDNARQCRPLVECMHQILPGLWTSLPGERVFLRVNQRHNAVADQEHGGKVLPAGGRKKHRRSSG